MRAFLGGVVRFEPAGGSEGGASGGPGAQVGAEAVGAARLAGRSLGGRQTVGCGVSGEVGVVVGPGWLVQGMLAVGSSSDRAPAPHQLTHRLLLELPQADKQQQNIEEEQRDEDGDDG